MDKELTFESIEQIYKNNSLKSSDRKNYNLLKVQNDNIPFLFEEEDGKYKVVACHVVPWIEDKRDFNENTLRKRIEPWLTALFQSEHLSLLAGSGLSHAVSKIADSDYDSQSMENGKFIAFGKQINKEAEESAKRIKRESPNIEDSLRVANELLSGLIILNNSVSAKNGSIIPLDNVKELKEEIQNKLQDFANGILECENHLILTGEIQREKAFGSLVSFLMSFASRTGNRDRLNIFTTNYDRIIEAGAEIAGLHLLDRFVGNLMPIFRSSRLDLDMHYNPPGIRGEPRYLEGVARYTKLHGSIDWVQSGKEIRRAGVPFGATNIELYLQSPVWANATAHELMIYPNSAKDRETALYPYVELFRDFAAAVCRPNSTIVAYGYSFGDEHINRMISDMLTIPSTHLVIISYSDPLNRIMDFYKKTNQKTQISLLIGPELGALGKVTDNYLPKPAIDKATYRLSELLKQRMGTTDQGDKKNDKSSESKLPVGGDS